MSQSEESRTRHYGPHRAVRPVPAPTKRQRFVASLVRAGVPEGEADVAYHRVIRAARRAGPDASAGRVAQLAGMVTRPLMARYAATVAP